MNGGRTIDATLGRTARAALEHLRRHSGYATWLLTRINDFERIVIASVDPQFSIVANSVLPNDLSTDRFLANASKMVVPIQLPNGQLYGSLIGLSRALPGGQQVLPNDGHLTAWRSRDRLRSWGPFSARLDVPGPPTGRGLRGC